MHGSRRGSPFLEEFVKGLDGWDYAVTSESTYDYNCFAYAADETFRVWDPSDEYNAYWPNGAPREITCDAFVKAYSSLGYEICDDETFDPAFEKIALYFKNNTPSHAAKQLDATNWTSKLGTFHDIRHPLRALEEEYGRAEIFLRRLRRQS